MESINDLKPRLEEIASLVDLAIVGEKNRISLKVLLKQISENLHNTVTELENIL